MSGLRMFVFCFFLISALDLYSGQIPIVIDDAQSNEECVATVRKHCSTLVLGKVPSETAIKKMSNDLEREAALDELSRIRQTARAIKDICARSKKSNFSVKQIIEIIDFLSVLQDKITASREVGSGNVELACFLAMAKAAFFFDAYNRASDVEKQTLSAFFKKDGAVITVDKYSKIFALESTEYPKQLDISSSSYDQMMTVALGTNLFVDQKSSGSKPYMEILAKKLQDENMNACLEKQLVVFKPGWFTWDILWATRLHVLCRLCEFIPDRTTDQKEAALRFDRFRSALSGLSENERKIVTAAVPSSSDLQRDAHVLLEVREYLSSKGFRILDMILYRLGNIE